jgi:hypothetical protein
VGLCRVILPTYLRTFCPITTVIEEATEKSGTAYYTHADDGLTHRSSRSAAGEKLMWTSHDRQRCTWLNSASHYAVNNCRCCFGWSSKCACYVSLPLFLPFSLSLLPSSMMHLKKTSICAGICQMTIPHVLCRKLPLKLSRWRRNISHFCAHAFNTCPHLS